MTPLPPATFEATVPYGFTAPESPLTPKSVSRHRGDRHDFVRGVQRLIREAVAKGGNALTEVHSNLFWWASDEQMLRLAWDTLAARGQAPGPDGWRYSEFDESGVWELLRDLSTSVRDGSYVPGPIRKIRIPKDRSNPGGGYRKLTLLNIVDRVLQRAIVETIQPILEPLFTNRSLGFRPRKNRYDALAVAEHITVGEGRDIWVTEDIRNAFDNVPIGRLLDVLRARVPNQKLIDLIRQSCATGKRGIQQGGPLSPLMLNLYLHHFLDSVWQRHHSGTPLVRYADDLLILCTSREEANDRLQVLQRILLDAGMQLKGSSAADVTHDIAGDDAADWLGFRILRAGERLNISIGDKCWSGLHQGLRLAHEKPNSPVRAIQTIESWIMQTGACHEWVDHDVVLESVRTMAAAEGFDELPSAATLLERWNQAEKKWQSIRTKVADVPQVAPAPVAAPVETDEFGDEPF